MDAAKIARINELAKKSKTLGLTDQERLEQKALRDEYIADVKRSLTGQLDNTYVMDEKGNLTKLKKK